MLKTLSCVRTKLARVLLQLFNVRDGEAEDEVHEDDAHVEEEEDEENLGDRSGMQKVLVVVVFAHKHRDNLKKRGVSRVSK